MNFKPTKKKAEEKLSCTPCWMRFRRMNDYRKMENWNSRVLWARSKLLFHQQTFLRLAIVVVAVLQKLSSSFGNFFFLFFVCHEFSPNIFSLFRLKLWFVLTVFGTDSRFVYFGNDFLFWINLKTWYKSDETIKWSFWKENSGSEWRNEYKNEC